MFWNDNCKENNFLGIKILIVIHQSLKGRPMKNYLEITVCHAHHCIKESH